MASKAAPKYIGYVGGVAVAAGIGTALAVAGQGTAHADGKDASAKSGAVDAGPKKADAEKRANAFSKPLSKVGSQAEQAADQVTKKLTAAVHTALKPTAKPQTAKVKPTAKEFEAEQVTLLKAAFTPKKAAAVTPTPTVRTDTTRIAAKSVDPGTVNAAASPGLPDPFRAVDPAPDDMPAPVLGLRNTFVSVFDPTLQPYAREGFEAAYRFSQTVPYVNAVVPITTILPAIGQALNGDAEAKQASQIIVNELLKTTQPVSLLYYGYDELADLANLEDQGTALKQQFYSTVWDTLDPLGLLHVKGESGLVQGA
jgi:hypothetical protein